MRAITVQQPMATAIVRGWKAVENRSRVEQWRGLVDSTLAIHAGKAWNAEYAETVEELTGRRLTPDDVPLGFVIGTARVSDVHWEREECCDPWGNVGTGVVHLVLDLVRPCVPVECRGNLGAWHLPDHVIRELGTVRA